MAINRPLRIPGRRFVLTKNMIEESQKHSKSNMEAARWLKVSYNTYRKWAKYYNLFDQHLNQAGFGVKKGWATYKIPLEDIFDGKSSIDLQQVDRLMNEVQKFINHTVNQYKNRGCPR